MNAMKVVTFTFAFMSYCCFAKPAKKADIPLPPDILVGTWHEYKPTPTHNDLMIITPSTVSAMGCEPSTYQRAENYQASMYITQLRYPDMGPIVEDFRVITIHLDNGKTDACLKEYQYIEFAFWVKEGSPNEKMVAVNFSESPEARKSGVDYWTTMSKK
jgi:hypothetical protein